MTLNRRTLLRGVMHGAAVSVSLPLLDMFLDDHGEALAATGQRIPARFGTWIWGCGFIPQLWIPKTTGTDYEMTPDLKPLEAFRKKMAVFSGYDVKLDGMPNKPHLSGCIGLRSGEVTTGEMSKLPTFDALIGSTIGAGTRFSSIEVSPSGIQRSYSSRGSGNVSPSETSPTALYQRIFGDGFQDPSSQKPFTPDPKTMVRRSVLSAVAEDRQRVMRTVGASDKQRLEEYFTSIRNLEEQLALQLEPPQPVANFVMPKAPEEGTVNSEITNVMKTHKTMAGLLAVALQCDQTRLVNVLFSDTTSNLRREGVSDNHHGLTHGEPFDKELGYQKQVAWFAHESMVALADFLQALDSIPEGKGTLLDNMVLLAHSDCSNANAHAVEGIPMIVAGNGGGKVKTGFHLEGKGDPNTRMGLTLQQAMGVQTERWGLKSMDTTRTISELLA
jgi:hypothetical protein